MQIKMSGFQAMWDTLYLILCSFFPYCSSNAKFVTLQRQTCLCNTSDWERLRDELTNLKH